MVVFFAAPTKLMPRRKPAGPLTKVLRWAYIYLGLGATCLCAQRSALLGDKANATRPRERTDPDFETPKGVDVRKTFEFVSFYVHPSFACRKSRACSALQGDRPLHRVCPAGIDSSTRQMLAQDVANFLFPDLMGRARFELCVIPQKPCWWVFPPNILFHSSVFVFARPLRMGCVPNDWRDQHARAEHSTVDEMMPSSEYPHARSLARLA